MGKPLRSDRMVLCASALAERVPAQTFGHLSHKLKHLLGCMEVDSNRLGLAAAQKQILLISLRPTKFCYELFSTSPSVQ